MKSYKIKCKEEDYSTHQETMRCVGANFDWFIIPTNSNKTMLVISNKLLEKIEDNTNVVSICDEKLCGGWGFMLDREFEEEINKYRYAYTSNFNKPIYLAEAFERILNELEKVEYIIYHS